MKKQLFLLVMFLLPIVAMAYNTQIDGIYYTINKSTMTASVTYGSSSYGSYSGDVTIPTSIYYQGKNYNVTNIDNSAFLNSSRLTSITIPNCVTTIGNAAFGNCSGLTSLTIHKSVRSIGGNAFAGCSGLTSIVVEDGNTKYDSRDGCNAIIETATNTLLSSCKNTVIPSSVTSIGDYAFSGCTGLTSIEIPSSVTSIGKYAFQGCTSLTSIEFPNSVTSIGNSAFNGCNNLTAVTIPNGITSIGREAFLGCSSLISIAIPNSLTSIGDYAFFGCNNLTSVTIESNAVVSETRTKENPLRTIFGSQVTDYIIGDEVTSIGAYAFYNCKEIETVTIGNSVTGISTHAFDGCTGLTSVTIGNSVTNILMYAFWGCTGLQSVTIPESVKEIGSYAFQNCSGLKSLTIGDNVTIISKFAFDNCTGLTSVIIPNVNYIFEYAFGGCKSLTSITIPSSVKRIDKAAFSACPGLVSITINSNDVASLNRSSTTCLSNIFGSQVTNYIIGDEVTEIGSYAFYNCSTMTSITIPNSLKSIGPNVFSECTGLTSITIPDSVTSIGHDAFFGCRGLTSVSIGNGLKEISYRMFYGCEALSIVTIGNSVTSIGNEAFCGCNALSTITIPKKLESIGEYAFFRCYVLTSIELPESVTSIGASAFGQCKELSDVYCYAENIPKTGSNPFYESNITYATLHVPAVSMEAYKSQFPWSEFKKIVSLPIPKFTLTYYVDGEEYKSYKIEKGSSIVPEAEPTKEGYTFSGWSEIPKTMPAHDITVTGTFTINKYKLTYTVDGEVYKSFDVEYGASITPEAEPTKEYYTFSGWSEIPKTMPAHDVTVSGTFAINKYKLTYNVDGELYKSYDVEYGLSITPEAEPIKEGYTFSGWSEIPETMPAHDVTVTGMFSVNKYKLIYIVDGELYKSFDVEYGTSITPEAVPTKEYYTFSGWSEIPRTMPANDVIVTGKFSINKYKLIYIVDGEFYKSFDVEYDVSITPEVEPTKEGYTFSGWSEIPETMPAHDVIVTGMFSVNSYKLTFMIDDKVYKETMYEYGATITPEPQPEGDYQTFEWIDLPQTMPAYDVVVYASYTSGIIEVLMASQHNVRIYSPNGKKLNKLQKGLNIIILDDGTVKKIIMK